MKIEKNFLTKLHRCYATSSTVIDGEKKILFATEGEGACYMYSGPEFEQSTVWDGPGGTMSIVAVPGKNGDFLAVQNFFPTFQSENATIVWGKPKSDGKWLVKTLFKLPYIHRFDILSANGVHYFIGCTLCTSKTEKEDWSDPGKIYVAVIPENLDEPMELKIIKTGMTKNHGYSRATWHGKMAGMVTCEEGVFAVTPPQKTGEGWTIETVLERPVSDIAVIDIDDDGEDELVTIEPFHGNQFLINKKTDTGYKVVYQYPEEMEFGHVVWGGQLRGVPTIIGGQRRHAKDLFYIQYQNGNYVKTTIETDIGPSNVAVINNKDRDIIISANREIGEAVLYLVTDK
ncbi:MAG: hypothetical protein H6Q70_3971 [Firmicutes bacterium]|nr:hypothetical protein [Bacillota bacterium]